MILFFISGIFAGISIGLLAPAIRDVFREANRIRRVRVTQIYVLKGLGL